MSKKLYVGNLSYDINESELRELFGSYGEIEDAVVIMDRDSGRSKGFGFVTIGDDQQAQQAIEDLNGKEHSGRTLTVNEARPRPDRGGRGGGGYRR
jgi:RNA recognition motif-containing protein